jgi:H+-transporting ATPase
MTFKKIENGEKTVDFKKISIDETVSFLKTDLSNGLKDAEVKERIKAYGYNEVKEKKVNPLKRFLKQFWGLSSWMLEVTVLLSWFLGKKLDMYIIIVLLFINAILGFSQEQKASQAVETLKEKLYINSRVLRDGRWSTIPARELAPGDIVRIRAGDIIPADLKIVQGALSVDQSTFTGESEAIDKNSLDLAFSGSIARNGEATGIVTGTGSKTYFGKIVELVQTARPKLHVEEVISKVVHFLLIIVGVCLGLLTVISYIKGIPIVEILPLILVLAVSAIPVALPAMFTISMALGSVELVNRGILITRLSATEDAALMNTLCADKTGTITMNKLEITNIIPLNGFEKSYVVLAGALSSQVANQDPIDVAFITGANKQKLDLSQYMQKEFIPFDPKTRMTQATILTKDGVEFKVIKGAVESVFEVCKLNDEEKNSLSKTILETTLRGYRTIAVAKEKEGKFQIVGIAALYDILRPDSKNLISELKELGISVKMLTGDALPVAKEIARQVGLGESVITVSELREKLKTSAEEAYKIADKNEGFAEVYPEDKYDIVKALQASGNVIGMTGDGVNDAPSLRQAEVGIAVSNATDVAKSSASAVLTNEGLINILDLVKVGRRIYQRILTWIFNKIIKTFQTVVFVSVAFLLTGKCIVSAFSVILLLFVIDFVTLSLSTDNVRWSKKPETWNISGPVTVAMIVGIFVVFESLGALYIGDKLFKIFSNTNTLQTFSFAVLFYSEMFTIFVVREREHFFNSLPSRTLFSSIIIDMIVVTLVVTEGFLGLKPISFTYTIFIFIYSFVFSLIVNDYIKYIILHKIRT